MKIILAAKSIYPFHPVGGVQKNTYHLARCLTGEGVDVEVVAPLDGGKPRTETVDGVRYTLLAPSIFRYLEYPIGWLGVHRFSASLSRYLQRNDFDLLHGFDMVGLQYSKLENRKPVIATIFTDNYLTNPISSNPLNILSFFGKKTQFIKQEKIKISPFADMKTILQYPWQYFLKARPMAENLNRADLVFVEDESFKQEVAELFRLGNDRCDVCPVGLDLSALDQKIQAAKLKRSDIGLKPEDIVLISVNRLRADKGVDKIMLAVKALIKDFSIKLLVVGDGYQKEELEALMRENDLGGHVFLLGNIAEDELYDYYRMSDIYICAFSYPGSSLSTLEAMACSLPMITTAQPWLLRGHENGMVIENNKPETIAKAVTAILQKGQLKGAGRVSREIVKTYDWRLIVKSLIKKYEAILHQNRGKDGLV